MSTLDLEWSRLDTNLRKSGKIQTLLCLVGKGPDINVFGVFKAHLCIENNVKSCILIMQWEADLFIYLFGGRYI